MTEHSPQKTKYRKPRIALTMGDPCGIGPEVIAKGLNDPVLHKIGDLCVIGDLQVMRAHVARFAPKQKVVPVQKITEAVFRPDILNVLQIGQNDAKTGTTLFPPGAPHPDSATTAFKAIEKAAKLALRGEIDAIATAPINKDAMQNIGFAFPGHTEFFAAAANTDDFGMMMTSRSMKIMLASIHLPLVEAISQLNADNLLKTIRLTHHTLKQDFGYIRPHIAVAGLNPHAGERGMLGQEEQSAVTPAIETAQAAGMHVSGPYPADTLFYKLRQGRFDAAVALYHDQALIPIKLLAFACAVNITAGLPFIRTSVDHGTAFDIAGQGIADPGSLQAAVRTAAEMARHRAPDRYF